MARPQIIINQEEFEKLCGLQCTEEEIADFFDCSVDTIARWCERTYTDEDGNPLCFAEVFAKKRGIGRISLRRAQYQLAKKNAAMAIFLGKQYLGQRDNVSESDAESIKRLDMILSTLKGEADGAEREAE